MKGHLLACKQFLKEGHVVTLLANERSFLKINDISIFGKSDCGLGPYCQKLEMAGSQKVRYAKC
jgi:hypothetical protein